MEQQLNGAQLIEAERERQITTEGWSEDHDDRHDGFEMTMAAVCYASCAAGDQAFTVRQDQRGRADRSFTFRDPWPWDHQYDKRSSGCPSPAERLRMLVKAGALIAAEIDRLQRLGSKSGAQR